MLKASDVVATNVAEIPILKYTVDQACRVMQKLRPQSAEISPTKDSKNDIMSVKSSQSHVTFLWQSQQTWEREEKVTFGETIGQTLFMTNQMQIQLFIGILDNVTHTAAKPLPPLLWNYPVGSELNTRIDFQLWIWHSFQVVGWIYFFSSRQ